MKQKLKVVVLTEDQLTQLITDTVDQVLVKRIPEIMRRANRKEYLTTSELKELTGMSYRMQKYHRDERNISYSQDGRKVFYKTIDVEQFMEERKIPALW